MVVLLIWLTMMLFVVVLEFGLAVLLLLQILLFLRHRHLPAE